ncbi:MAG: hypothetical protein EOO09_03155 [Chitinophagaceae bacterium]|nr:MAG: hypothetical protein EOO09_03155 [Chitinophagaceae bacterium]
MKQILLIASITFSLLSCSKDKKQDVAPGDNTARLTVGAKTYEFTEMSNASENYFEESTGKFRCRLNGADGVSFISIRIDYLYDPIPPIPIYATTGGPSAGDGRGAVEFTDEAGVLYKLKDVEETPWFKGTLTAIEGNTWTGNFTGYVHNPAGARFDMSNGQFKVTVARK